MAFTHFVRDIQVSKASINSSGVANWEFAIPTDRVVWCRVRVIMGQSSSGHVAAGGNILGECIVENQNGSLSLPNALSSSANPQGPTAAQGADSAFGPGGESGPYLLWNTSGANITLALGVGAGSLPGGGDAIAIMDMYQAGYA